eukprot:gnl/MRDRNA2_/MRDRNA2_115073_c0_seq1.p1 gnl/MRDRNA2_/MRDRNA2_115073_c0~~gnl/MRDRNA2_/MRDRNA2_115073_c0_seq1.p1  ORF type:complete len:871 (+),score=176.10 gnl/MRDRNA2_/MRDRNA2_115073_c0_seq1:69-2681(+)
MSAIKKTHTLQRSGSKVHQSAPSSHRLKSLGGFKKNRQSVEEDENPIVEDGNYEALGQSFGLEEVKVILARDPKQRDEKSLQRVLDWLIRDAAQVGMEIAPELQVPHNVLLQALRKAFVITLKTGDFIYDESEEIRCFSMVLSGRLRRRRLIKKGTDQAADEDGGEEGGETTRKTDCTIEFITRGEVLGMLLNPDKAASGVQAVVESQVLMINSEDYGATLKPFHKEMATEAMEFLRDKGLVDNPTQMVHQLIRLAPMLRSRKIQRGRFITSINQPQRHVWILRKGCCSLLLRKEDGSQEIESEKRIGLEPPDPLSMLLQREASPLESKALGLSQQTIASHARGPLRQMLQGQDSQLKGLEGRTKVDGGTEVALVATLTEPGTLLGEEVLLNDTEKGMAAARSYYSIRVEEDSLFYCLDFTGFKKLADILGQENIASKMQYKMNRRKESLQKNVKVLSKLNLNARTSVARELERMEDQTLGMNTYQSSALLASRPMNAGLIAGGLLCIQNGSSKVTDMQRYGPGVERVMAQYRKLKDPRAKQKTLGDLHSLNHASSSLIDDNPLGGSVAVGCSFDKPPPLRKSMSVPNSLILNAISTTLGTATGGLPGLGGSTGGGVVFSTEVDMPAPVSLGTLPSEAATSAPSPPSPQEQEAQEEESDEEKSFRKNEEARSKEERRKRRIVNAFRRVVRGRSFVVLTEDNDVRNVLKKTFLSLRAELLFVKTAMELLHVLSDPRQTHHVFLLDLAKPDLNVDGLLRTIRRAPRYQAAPVIAISLGRNLPELVKSTCSYVVFKPPSPDIVREATVWCLDRGVLESHFRQEGTLGEPESSLETQNASGVDEIDPDPSKVSIQQPALENSQAKEMPSAATED